MDDRVSCGVCGSRLQNVETSTEILPPPNREVESSSQEQEILRITSELCQKIGLRLGNALSVSWKSRIPLGRGTEKLWSDDCTFDRNGLVLPETMKGVLQPEEWSPIIAATLMYTYKLGGEKSKHLIKRWGLGVMLPALIGGTLLAVLYDPGDVTRDFVGLMVGMFLLVLGLGNLISAPYIKRIRLKADRMAADLVRKDLFLRTLSVISRNMPEDLANLDGRRGLRALYSKRPSISERIENLQSNRW